MVSEDQQIADMMTDKATVEMEAPVSGKVIEVAGAVGDQIAIGSVLVVFETEGAASDDRKVEPEEAEEPIADGMAPIPDALEVPTTDVEVEERRTSSERRTGDDRREEARTDPDRRIGEWRANPGSVPPDSLPRRRRER